MVDVSGEQFPLPLELSKIFEDGAAQQLNEACEYFDMEPEKLMMYGLGVVLYMKSKSELTGQLQQIFIGPNYAGPMTRLVTPKEAAERKIL